MQNHLNTRMLTNQKKDFQVIRFFFTQMMDTAIIYAIQYTFLLEPEVTWYSQKSPLDMEIELRSRHVTPAPPCVFFLTPWRAKVLLIDPRNISITGVSFLWYVYVLKERPWSSGSVLGCWSTGRAIDPAPGAWFIAKFISQVVPVLDSLSVQNRGLNHHLFHSICISA